MGLMGPLPEGARAFAGLFFEAEGEIKGIREPEFGRDFADGLAGQGEQVPRPAKALFLLKTAGRISGLRAKKMTKARRRQACRAREAVLRKGLGRVLGEKIHRLADTRIELR